ncbi:MAG: PAS domain-containing protein [Anaerostipes sp.]|nr:PAS domain-containing protein [Anaerostipes sp.]
MEKQGTAGRTLQVLREKAEQALSGIPGGLCVYYLEDGQVYSVFCSPAFYEVLGYSDGHISEVMQTEQGLTFSGVHKEDVPELQEKVNQLLHEGTALSHTCRIFHDKKGIYRWIHMDGAMGRREDRGVLFYIVFSDVSSRIQTEEELMHANAKMQDIINAIPGGVAVYKVSDIFETVYFSDGVPELSGYTVEEYRKLIKKDAADMTYWEDKDMVVSKAAEVIQSRGVSEFEFRKQHRDGHIVWVHIHIKWIGEEDGCPLLHCVFHNITGLKQIQLEKDHLINSIPGGIASYRVEGERFIAEFFSEGVMALSGHTRKEYEDIVKYDALDVIYAPDRKRVLEATKTALVSGEVLDVSYRIYHKDGHLIWIHLNGRRMGPLSKTTRFYAVFTGMSAETRLFQSIANETADGIYVIEKENYDLLYANESTHLFMNGKDCVGQKCYKALHGNDRPCSFCQIKRYAAESGEHEMKIPGSDRVYTAHFRETDWNGIPAYIQYVHDVTEEVTTRREKERLEMYFQTIIKNLPGGISVIRCEPDGTLVSEFISEGYAAMTHMTVEEAEKMYEKDILAGICPDDVKGIREKLQRYINEGEGNCELTARVMLGDGGYIWVKCMLSLLRADDGVVRLYAVYTDITQSVEEQEKIRSQYKDLILQHYRTPGPNALVVGHCNITRSKILDIIDYTDSDLLKTFGDDRQRFFTGLSGLIVDGKEQREFLETYLNEPALKAFEEGKLERQMECFVRFPKDSRGRYVQVKMHMVATPDSGDVTGILTVTDITEQAISDRILHQLSVTGCDLVVDVDLTNDTYSILSSREASCCVPPVKGCHSEWTELMLQTRVVPRDKEQYKRGLDPAEMYKKLERQGSYTFAFSVMDDNGDIRTKNMTVSAVDLRLGRVCLSRSDITDSIREQQGLLHMIAYTFELAAFIDIGSRNLTLYTREIVLENLPAFFIDHYDEAILRFVNQHGSEENLSEDCRQFQIPTMIERLEEQPNGYDFLFSYQDEAGERYKQINVLWGDVNHRTLCLVRADVTDMLAAERRTKKDLEDALSFAEEANKAKSDFLSAMSHDIRTPMNAIMGMTTLASAFLDDKERVKDCLHKIAISSNHLLSLINDILDMSKIERSQINLNSDKVFLPELMEQISAIIKSQTEDKGIEFRMRTKNISKKSFYGDALRINQILINILSNAIKFTEKGGSVEFTTEEINIPEKKGRVRYLFTVRDTGIGMPKEFLEHVFEPFTRSSNAARIEGTGLGLSITKGLVDLMEGNITVESRIGAGSVFEAELEFDAAQAAGEPPAGMDSEFSSVSDEKMFAGRCFLVAEDNAINAEILCELLRMCGAESVLKTDGAQAVRAFQEAEAGTYDAVLMDIQMPEMNGYEAARRIREMERADAVRIPIIAMTANAFDEDVQNAYKAGMNAHVAKPIDLNVLKTALQRSFQKVPGGRRDMDGEK